MSLMAYVEITRPINTVFAALAITLAAVMTKEIEVLNIALAIISAGLISSAGNSINDYYDHEIDMVNKPERPIPSGRVSLKGAFYYSIVLFLAGCIVSLFINQICAVIAILSSVALYLYASRLKNAGFIGNITIATLTGMAIIYGGLAVASIDKIITVALFAFLINLAREIVKDAEDMEGDSKAGARTLALRYGLRTALILASFPLWAIIITTPVPYMSGLYNNLYMAIIVFGIDIPIVHLIYSLYFRPSTATAVFVKKMLKMLILIGLIGIYVGL